jgi:hypothetical protein
MTGLGLIDAAALLFLAVRVGRASHRRLGESVHGMFAWLLLVGLALGFRLASELRQVLGTAADWLQAVPGLGTKLLIIVGAWYIMRLLRTRSGDWIQQAVPARLHGRLLPFTEAGRALLIIGLLAWLVEGLFPDPPSPAPYLVELVRVIDRGLTRIVGGA